MAQTSYYTFTQSAINGNIMMSAQVFDEITKRTVRELENVSLDTSKGIQIPGTKAVCSCSIVDNNVIIDIHVRIKYGVNISKKTLEIQEKIATNIKQYTNVDVKQINIEVDNIEF